MIARRISGIFGLGIDKDVVGQVLAKCYHPAPDHDVSPSWAYIHLPCVKIVFGVLTYFGVNQFT